MKRFYYAKKFGVLIIMFSMGLILCSCGKQEINYAELFEEKEPLEAIRSAYGYSNSTEDLANEPEFIAASKNYIDQVVSERDWDALEEYIDTLKYDWNAYPDEIADTVKLKISDLISEADHSGCDFKNEEGFYSSKEDEMVEETDSDGYDHTIWTYYYGDLLVEVDSWNNPLSLYDNLSGTLTTLYYKDMKLSPNPYGESKTKDHFPPYNEGSIEDVNLYHFYFSEDYIIYEEEEGGWIIYDLTEERYNLYGCEIYG